LFGQFSPVQILLLVFSFFNAGRIARAGRMCYYWNTVNRSTRHWGRLQTWYFLFTYILMGR